MGHVPHVYLPPPWPEGEIPMPAAARHHLMKVLRSRDGAPVSYTDGAGTVGTGTLAGAAVERGEERAVAAPAPPLTVAVAPPRAKERARTVVEKLAELGVDRLLWVATRYGEGKAPARPRSLAWAVAALEQSRGAHLMAVDGPVPFAELPEPRWVAMSSGGPLPSVTGPVTMVVGPEGGFAPDEVPETALRVGLGARILRTETAAVVAATLVLASCGRITVC